MNARTFLLLLVIAATPIAHDIASAENLEAPQKALELITNTADRICNVVSSKGEANSEEAKGNVTAQLKGLASKLADIGVSGSGSINNETYQNVLRQDLSATLKDNAACKLKVFDTLQNKLLGILPNHPLDEKLPGFASGMMVQTNDSTEMQRKYQFDFRTREGAKAAFFLSASNRFAFSVTDIHGEPYTLEIPFGSNGVPFEKFVYVFCEVGIASSYSYLRALVNGKEVAWRDYEFPIDLGSRQWLPTIGADSNGKNGGAFDFTEMVAFSTTLSDAELMVLTNNALQFYNLGSPAQ